MKSTLTIQRHVFGATALTFALMASSAGAQTVIGTDTIGGSPISHAKDLAITPDQKLAVLHIRSSRLNSGSTALNEHMPIIDMETGATNAILPFGGYTDFFSQRLCINSVEVTNTRAVAIGRRAAPGGPNQGIGRIRLYDITPGSESMFHEIDLQDASGQWITHQVIIPGNQDFAAVLAVEATLSGNPNGGGSYLFVTDIIDGQTAYGAYPLNTQQGINGVISLLDASTDLIAFAAGNEIAVLDTTDLTSLVTQVAIPNTAQFADVAITPDETWAVAVADQSSPASLGLSGLTFIDLGTTGNPVTTIPNLVNPDGVEALEVTNSRAVVMGRTPSGGTDVFVYDLTANPPVQVGSTVSLTGTPHDLTLSSNGNRADG